MSHAVQLDENGAHKSEFRCKHANFIFKTEVEGELEFLFSAYSVFKVFFFAGWFDGYQCAISATQNDLLRVITGAQDRFHGARLVHQYFSLHCRC